MELNDSDLVSPTKCSTPSVKKSKKFPKERKVNSDDLSQVSDRLMEVKQENRFDISGRNEAAKLK